MSLTSQHALLEREHIRKCGEKVTLRVQSVQTIDFTTPKGAITRDSYEQQMLALPGQESMVATGGYSRSFRVLTDDLPTAPSSEFKIVFEGLVYSVKRHSSGRAATVLHCTRS